jgi:hypothetical protein
MNMHPTSTFPTRTGKRAATPSLTMNQRKRRLLLMGLMVTAACAIGQTAEAQVTPSTPIDSCGTVISEPGFYIVTKPLQSNSDTVDCIQINASGVGLGVSYKLTGPGGADVTAAGIRVSNKATGVWLYLLGATIEDFGVGIVVQGSGVSMTDGGQEGNFVVQGNAAQGVLISNTSNVIVYGLESTGNGQAGLELSNASGVIVEGSTMLESNGTHGLWVNSSAETNFSASRRPVTHRTDSMWERPARPGGARTPNLRGPYRGLQSHAPIASGHPPPAVPSTTLLSPEL